MHRRTHLALLVGLCTVGFAVAQEQPTILDPETVVRLATANAASLTRLERAVAEAADALGWGAYRDDLSLSLTGSLAGNELDALSAAGGATLRATLDVLPQLTLTGELAGEIKDPAPAQAQALSGSVGVTVKPLADAKGSERDRIAYERAELALEAEARKVAYTAIVRLLEAVSASEALEIARPDLAIAEARLASVEALHARDRATDDELENARDALRSSRHSRERAELAAERARWSLADSVGLREEELDLPAWELLDLASLAERIPATAEFAADTLVAASAAVRAEALDLQAARVELEATRRFTPELSAGAQLRFPLEPDVPRQQSTYSVTLGLTVSPSDWDGSVRLEAEQDVTFAERDLVSAETDAAYDLREALLDLEIAGEELAAERHDLALAEQDLAEAEFRFDRGTNTRLDLDTARLAREKAEAAVDTALATLAKQWYRIDLGQW